MTNSETKILPTDESEFTYEIKEPELKIIRYKDSSVQNNHAVKVSSSKIKLKNIVSYQWETKEYRGRLIACHINGELIAYQIKMTGTSNSIRVVNVNSSQRCLIKGLSSDALDLEFAHMKDPVLLAYIEHTTMYVQKITNNPEQLTAELVFTLVDPITEPFTNFKISWCPYVPESKLETDMYTGQLIVWSRGNIFQCYSINDLISNIGAGPHKPEAAKEFGRVYKELQEAITDIVFSPDGSTLAVCTEGGLVRFFQIYLHSLEDAPRQVHEWKPHDGAKVDRILFLDDLTESMTEDPLWLHVITCAYNNTELKLWNCDSWECLQTIKFDVPSGTEPKPNFKVSLDETASYLLMSDINNFELLVLQIQKTSSTTTNSDEGSSPEVKNVSDKTSIKAMAKYTLVTPILSFGVTDIAVKRLKHPDDFASYMGEEFDDYEDDNDSNFSVVMTVYAVQPKSVARCLVLYQPSKEIPAETNGGTSEDAISEPVKDAISAKSSPSREVENILAFNKNDDVFEAMYDAQDEDLDDQVDQDLIEQVDDLIQQVEDLDVAELEKEEEKDVVVEENELIEEPTEWPTAPVVVPQMMLQEKDLIIPAPSNHQVVMNNIDAPDATATGAVSAKQFERISKILEDQTFEIDQMRVEMKKMALEQQQRELKHEVMMSQLMNLQKTTQEEMSKLASRSSNDSTNTNSVDQLLKKFSTNCQTQMETAFKDSMAKKIENQISTILATKLDAILDKQNTKLHQELLKQTQTNELLLNLNKNQMFNDALGKSISAQLKPTVEAALIKCISTSLVPAYENLTKDLFNQLHQLFGAGIKEYTSMFEKHIHQMRYNDDHQAQLLAATKILPDQIQKRLDDLKNSNSVQINQIINKDLKVIHASILKVVREQIKIEMDKGFKEQSDSLESSMLSVVRSQAQTPVPSAQELQTKIIYMLGQSRINEAFHAALIANDLSLVEFTLEKADFGKVFTPCALEQTVLLSLIQQLTADMKNHNEVKNRYLCEAIMNLDFKNKLTKEHGPNILHELRSRCQEFRDTNPSHPLDTSVKVLIVASQGIENASK